jgi:hypothetical protein
MNVVDQTTAGAASGESALGGAEGFIISGKRTDDKIKVCFFKHASFCYVCSRLDNVQPFYFLFIKYNNIEERERWKEKQL